MNFDVARSFFLEEFFKGRRKQQIYNSEIFPFSRIRYHSENFLSKKIPILEIAEMYTTQEELVDKYVEYMKIKNMPPIWVSYGKKLKDDKIIVNWHKKFEIKDGNHRFHACKKLKINMIDVIIPESHYRTYIERTQCRPEL